MFSVSIQSDPTKDDSNENLSLTTPNIFCRGFCSFHQL